MALCVTAKMTLAIALSAAFVLPAQAAPSARDACKLLPQGKVAPILGNAVRQDQPPKAQGGYMVSACIFAAGRKGAAAQFMLMTYPDSQSALVPTTSGTSSEKVAGVQAVWNGNFLFASRDRERYVIMALSNSETEKHGMAKALLAVALAAH